MAAQSFATLVKLQKTRVDEQRQLHSRLQGELEDIERRILELEIEKAREQAVAEENDIARQGLGAYLKAAVKKGRDLEREKQIALVAVESAREQLMFLFEEQKRYEIAETARLAALEKEEKRQETIQLDEVGSVTYTRRKE